MMKVTRQSMATGKMHTLKLDVTEDQMRLYVSGAGLVQNIFPHLSPDEREFIMTGITREEWEEIFGKEKHATEHPRESGEGENNGR